MKVTIDSVGLYFDFIDINSEYKAKDKYDFRDVVDILLTNNQKYKLLSDNLDFIVSKKRYIQAIEYLESAKLKEIEFNIYRT